MVNIRRVLMIFIALIVLVGGTGVVAHPAQASSCVWHTVRWGESLSWIGRWYGVYWPSIANANGIHSPYKIYAGQVLCVPYGYGYGYGYSGTGSAYPYYTGGRTWSYNVSSVQKDTSVTIKGHNFPSNVWFKVRMRQAGNNSWESLPDLDTNKGGNSTYVINIPASLHGKSQLVLRLTQNKKNGKSFTQDVQFGNYTGSSGSGSAYPPGYWNGYGWYYHGIPTIWIDSVVRNSTVTIHTNNFPAGLTFDVYMGPMGTRGVGGYHVGTLHSGSGGYLTATYSIPSALYGSHKISIRTQNHPTGFYSYNWFYNNTAY
jgi:LysM repeat protein